MEQKVIFITGATNGIGKITAKELAKQGHIVIIHGRSSEKTKAVCEEIKAETGNPNVDFLLADLFLLAEVRKLAEAFKQKYDRLDILINNAGGVFGKERQLTKEGIEQTFALNLFSPFLLTHLLLDLLAKSPAARIVEVASAAYKYGGQPDYNDFQVEKSYEVMRAYGLAKLYVIWNTRHLAKLLKEKGLNNITVNALHPGSIATNFGQTTDKGWLYNFAFQLTRPFLLSPEKGAETTIYLASSDEVKNISGQYFEKKKIAKVTVDKKYYSAENEQLVWEYCRKLTES
ncbi:MAG: SDR family NAD(P)-dependent oxidoreductase [Paludibacteraceae bacterium]